VKELKNKQFKMPYLIAVTGNFGTGKSLVGNILCKKGITVIDTDDIVANILASKNKVTDKIVNTFGKVTLFHAKINKKALANIVFKNKSKRKLLESIIHPVVRDELKKIIKVNKAKKIIAVLIPLLFESGMERNYHEIWCVICSKDVQLKRLMKKGFTSEEIKLRLNSQMNQSFKARKSNFVINNSKSINYSKKQILKRLKLLARLDRSRHLFLSK